MDQYAVISVATSLAIVQRWRITSTSTGQSVEVVDLASYPHGFSCPGTIIATYETDLDSDCSGRICVDSDNCEVRAQLLHDSGFNNFEGDMCSNTIATYDNTVECSDGRQWNKGNPKDCVAQNVPGGCMFCAGIAMGEKTQWCLDREGASCQNLEDSSVRQTFCNIEFECPASSIAVSVILIISSLLALFLQ